VLRIIGATGAILAIAALIAAWAATASATWQQAPSFDTVGLGGRLGSGSGLEARRGNPKTRDASGGFIYHNGRYRPLDSVDGLITTHHSINNRGLTTGGYLRNGLDTPDPDPEGFVRRRSGRYKRFDAFPGLSTVPSDINDRGTTVGLYGSLVTGEAASFLRRASGDVTTVEVPGAQLTGVLGLNNRETMVGTYADAEGTSRAFLMERGRVTTLDPPDAPVDALAADAAALDVNDRGQVVGCYADANGTYHGFHYDKGRFSRIDPPGGADVPMWATTCALGLNNRGHVVGQYVDAEGVLHGYLWRRGSGFETIDLPRGAPLVSPTGDRGATAADVNDRGEIVIAFAGAFGKQRGVPVAG
jgi:probable HAF family extracellular repeat protein